MSGVTDQDVIWNTKRKGMFGKATVSAVFWEASHVIMACPEKQVPFGRLSTLGGSLFLCRGGRSNGLTFVVNSSIGFKGTIFRRSCGSFSENSSIYKQRVWHT
ncbi:hypothetical protein C0J52_13407 [Blattella germanica]|nr:hypothetical protein C0J52_13407 [Blattella germanica]